MPSLIQLFLNEKDNDPAKIKEPKNKEKIKDPKLEEDDTTDEGDDDALFDDIDDEGLDLENNKDDENPDDETDTSEDDNTDDTGNDDLGDAADDLGDAPDLGNGEDTDDPNADDNIDADNPEDEENMDDTDTTQDDGSQDKINRLLLTFNKLYNDCQQIIDSINSANKNNNPLEYKTLSNVVDNLQGIKNTMYDYIMYKYKKKSYQENLYTYFSMLYSIKKTQEIVKNLIEIRNKA